MKRALLKKLQEYYSEKMSYCVLNGTRRPKYDVMFELDKQGHIPFKAWRDIKAYLQENDTKKAVEDTTAKGA